MAGWLQEGPKSDARFEVNGLRAEIAYVVQPIDCSGVIIPAYLDINDARWDEDPRVQHWRRETQLGRVMRRETPKTVHPTASAGTSVPRDPRLKSDAQPASAMSQSQLQLQQQHIQQMVHQLMQRGTSATTGAGLPATETVSASAPATAPVTAQMSAVNSGSNTSQFPQLLNPGSGVNPTLETGPEPLQLPSTVSYTHLTLPTKRIV